MKRLAVFLALNVLFLCLAPAAAAADTAADTAAGTAALPVTFAVASDLHYNEPDPALTYFTEDPLFGHANRRAALENESGPIIDAFLAEAAADDAVSFVLISGDLADNGKTKPEEHYAVAEKLARFERESGKEVYVINGNHDASLNPGDTSFDDFKAVYADFGYDRAVSRREEDCSYTADPADGVRLIALDSCSKTKSTEDGMTLSKVIWVMREAAKAKREGREPILMMHHNLLDHLPAQRIVSHDFIVRFHSLTALLFSLSGVRVVLTGHEHCSDAAVKAVLPGRRIYDFATTSLTMYPLSYRRFTLSGDTLVYGAPAVSKIDTAAVAAATAGYTPEQLSLMESDLAAYSLGYFKAGVKYRLALGLSDEKLGIAPGEPFYGVAHTAAAGLLSALDTPYAGEKGLAAGAARFGMALPETDAETPWDLITTLAAAHYAGEEPYTPDSPEVRLLLKTAAFILRTVLPDTADASLFAAANRLLSSDQTGLARRFAESAASLAGDADPAGYLAAALLSPLLIEFSYDGDGVPDNAGRVVLQTGLF